ncbi:MAG: hypothetical protein ACXABY_12870 [Candidatus Thorarchaeota archaeon]|jgi:hypothetical protein
MPAQPGPRSDQIQPDSGSTPGDIMAIGDDGKPSFDPAESFDFLQNPLDVSLIFSPDNTHDIGALGGTGPASRPRRIFAATEVVVGDTLTIGTDSITSTTNLIITPGGTGSVVIDGDLDITGSLNVDGSLDIPLATILAAGNSTGGTNLDISSGDRIVSSNDTIVFQPTNAVGSTGLRVLNIGGSGNTSVSGNGTLTISGDSATTIFNGATGNITIQTNQGDILFRTTGITRWRIASNLAAEPAGTLIAGVDNTYDIGISGDLRPRRIYVGTEIVVGDTITIGANSISSSAALSIIPGSGLTNMSGDLTLTGDLTVNGSIVSSSLGLTGIAQLLTPEGPSGLLYTSNSSLVGNGIFSITPSTAGTVSNGNVAGATPRVRFEPGASVGNTAGFTLFSAGGGDARIDITSLTSKGGYRLVANFSLNGGVNFGIGLSASATIGNIADTGDTDNDNIPDAPPADPLVGLQWSFDRDGNDSNTGNFQFVHYGGINPTDGLVLIDTGVPVAFDDDSSPNSRNWFYFVLELSSDEGGTLPLGTKEITYSLYDDSFVLLATASAEVDLTNGSVDVYYPSAAVVNRQGTTQRYLFVNYLFGTWTV